MGHSFGVSSSSIQPSELSNIFRCQVLQMLLLESLRNVMLKEKVANPPARMLRIDEHGSMLQYKVTPDSPPLAVNESMG